MHGLGRFYGSHIYTNGKINTQNYRIWSEANSHARLDYFAFTEDYSMMRLYCFLYDPPLLFWRNSYKWSSKMSSDFYQLRQEALEFFISKLLKNGCLNYTAFMQDDARQSSSCKMQDDDQRRLYVACSISCYIFSRWKNNYSCISHGMATEVT